MRLGASAATMAFGLFVLVSGNLHAQKNQPMGAEEDWPMYGRNLKPYLQQRAVPNQSFQRIKSSTGLVFSDRGCSQRVADRRRRSGLCGLLGWVLLCA